MAMQSSSHSCPRDNKEEFVMPSKTWAVRALAEKLGWSGRQPVCVARIVVQSGSITVGPVEVACRLVSILRSCAMR